MSSSSVRIQARSPALGLLLTLCLASPALADDLTPAPSPAAAVDDTPTGAVRAKAAPEGVSRLDLAPPPGLSLDPPPDAAPPGADIAPAPTQADLAPPKDPAATPADSAKPSSQAPPSTPETPASIATPEPSPAPEASPTPVAAPAPPPDLPSAIHAELDRLVAATVVGRPIGAGDWGAALKAIADAYAAHDYAPFWMDGDRFNERARSAVSRLQRADEDGLDLHDTPATAADLAGADFARRAEAELALSKAVVAYAMQAGGARIRPRYFSKDVTAQPELADPGAALKQVAEAEDADAALAAFNPPQPGYAELRAALARLRGDRQQPVAHLSTGPELRLGMSDPRVPLIRARFGVGSASESSSADVYDIKVASAVAAFQRVHGLKGGGALTTATAEALDGRTPNSPREQAILANMEMWRWQPRDMGETRVEVNVPDFSLKLMNGDEVVHQARVIVGKPDTPTPIFSNSIKYMLFNPVWRVPQSIIKKEMAPKLAGDPNYLARHGYKVTYVGNQIEVEQPPGEANALGHMLFLFPNEHAVYLHDTPQRSLFSASYRALSHGCVRVEDPSRLAEILMGGAARGWNDAKVKSLVGDKERTLSLPTPVPIHLEYFTEFVDPGGRLQEREDLYGLTSRVASTLASFRRD